MITTGPLIALAVCLALAGDVVGRSLDNLKTTIDNLKMVGQGAPAPVKVGDVVNDQLSVKPDIDLIDTQSMMQADNDISNDPIKCASEPVVAVPEVVPTSKETAFDVPAKLDATTELDGFDQILKQLLQPKRFPDASDGGDDTADDDQDLDWIQEFNPVFKKLFDGASQHQNEL